MKSLNTMIFLLLLCVLLLDRVVTLYYLGFVYTDIDQLVLWNGAVDYSNGIFHEPFFYGQPYNYMLEALVAAPLLYLNVPVYQALPVATSVISVLPFILLALFLFKKRNYFWSFLSLALPVLLPLQYNFLSTISRGFVQAHVFIPLLFIPLFEPEKKRNIIILFLASAVCFVANQSSILVILPVFVYVASFHYKSASFYLSALWTIPVFIVDFLCKYYYRIHPEKVLHSAGGMKLSIRTFAESFSNPHLFENLYPFSSGGGLYYLLIFLPAGIFAFRNKLKSELLFILTAIIIILVSFAIPKVQDPYPVENAGVFFSVSRFYLLVPLLVITSLYLVFRKVRIGIFPACLLAVVCLFSFFMKNIPVQRVVKNTVEKTSFPIAKNEDLVNRADKLKALVSEYDIDLLVHKMSPEWDWNNLYDSYALYPLVLNNMHQKMKTISVNLNGDRRTWLYEDSKFHKRILLVGISVDEDLLKPYDYEIVGDNYILIKNHPMSTSSLFETLGMKYGNN